MQHSCDSCRLSVVSMCDVEVLWRSDELPVFETVAEDGDDKVQAVVGGVEDSDRASLHGSCCAGLSINPVLPLFCQK